MSGAGNMPTMSQNKRNGMANKSTQRVVINGGDYVLLGGTQASYPGHWYLGRVLWVGDTDILIKRSTVNGETWREVHFISEIRAVGSVSDLVSIQETAREECSTLQKIVREAETALGEARTNLFAKLERLAAGGLAVIPPDFSKIEEDRLKVQGQLDLVEAPIGADAG